MAINNFKKKYKIQNSKTFGAWEEIERQLESMRLSWWIRFLLFFRKPIYGVDWGYGFPVIICMKMLFGICYVTSFCDTKELKKFGFKEGDGK